MKTLDSRISILNTEENLLSLFSRETFDYDVQYKTPNVRCAADKVAVELPFNAYAFMEWVDDKVEQDNNDQVDKIEAVDALEYANISFTHMLRLTSDENVVDVLSGKMNPVDFYEVSLDKAIESYVEFVMEHLMSIPTSDYEILPVVEYLDPSGDTKDVGKDIFAAIEKRKVLMIPIQFKNPDCSILFEMKSKALHFYRQLINVTQFAVDNDDERQIRTCNLSLEQIYKHFTKLNASLFELWENSELEFAHISDHPFVKESYKLEPNDND